MKEITENMVRKMKFTSTYLEPILKRLDPEIMAAGYTYDHATGDEYISLMRNSGTQNICVTEDGFAQMAVDTIQKAVLS